MKYFSVVIFLLFVINTSGQSVVINEIMAANKGYINDEDGDESDWIELHNQSEDAVELFGYYLSDNVSNPLKWPLPDIVLEADDYLLIFASGKDRIDAEQELHTNFSISSQGEEVLISYFGDIVHQLPPIALSANRSFGLLYGEMQPVVYLQPTPGAPNLSYPVVLDTLIFSHSGGIYSKSFSLEIESNTEEHQIFYTIDGTTPTANSLEYLAPLYLDNELTSSANINQMQITPDYMHDPPDVAEMIKSIVIRAAAFDSYGNQVSEVLTHSFFIHQMGVDHGDLPIVSICADYDDLFDYETGIMVPGIHWNPVNPDWSGNYFMRGHAWEREASIEIIDGENTQIRQNGGLRTHGGNGRRHAQKSLRLYARSKYGQSRFEMEAFEGKEIESFKRFVLKPFASSWSDAGFEDYICNQIAAEINVDVAGTRPVVMYLNGEYWGIYYLQERIDGRFLEDNFGMNTDNVDLIQSWNGSVSQGDNSDFFNFIEFISAADLEDQLMYEYVTTQIDIDNFIDYQLFEIFSANYDWPANNMKCWKPHAEDGKWRWIFFDGDAALYNADFHGFSHALSTANEAWPTNSESTLVLRKLLTNDVFFDQFFSRLETLMNNQLSPDKTLKIVNDAIIDIEHEIANQSTRFKVPGDYSSWDFDVNNILDFLGYRPCVMQEQALEQFQFGMYVESCDDEENILADLTLYPNPNRGTFNLRFHSDKYTKATVDIFNAMGQRVAEMDRVLIKGENEIGFSISQLRRGFYIVRINSTGEEYSVKMLVIE